MPEARMKPKRYPSREVALSRFRLMPPGTSAHPDLLDYIASHSIRQNEDGTWTWRFDEAGTSRPTSIDFPEAEELDIESITCPTLVIYGEYSELFDPEEARIIVDRLPNATLVELPGAYHHLMLDRPRAFNEAIRKFFRQNGM